MEAKISVIIPVYNAEKTILSTLTSVFNQDCSGLVEIIVIDDGSTDNTHSILKKLTAENLKIIKQDNRGVSCARNVGILEANGRYLTFLDSDDKLDGDVLRKMLDCAEENLLDLVACNHTEMNATNFGGNDDNSGSFIATNVQQISDHFFDVFPKSSVAKLFRTSVIRENNVYFPDHMNLGEDLYFTYSFLLHAKRIGKVGDAYYRIQNVNPDSLSKKYIPYKQIEADLERQNNLWKEVCIKYPMIKNNYNNRNMDYRLSLIATYTNNLYKWDCNISFKEKVYITKEFLKNHQDWQQSAYSNKNYKNTYERVLVNVIKTNNAFLLNIFMSAKERIKKRQFQLREKNNA